MKTWALMKPWALCSVIVIPLFALLLNTFLLVAFSPFALAMEPTFRPLEKEQTTEMDSQRAYLKKLVAAYFPTLRLNRTKEDYAVLQKIIDAKIIPEDDGGKRRALGIAFGDVMFATIEDLQWRQVTGDQGTDLTLRYRETPLHFDVIRLMGAAGGNERRVDVAKVVEEVAAKLKTYRRENP